MLLIQVTF